MNQLIDRFHRQLNSASALFDALLERLDGRQLGFLQNQSLLCGDDHQLRSLIKIELLAELAGIVIWPFDVTVVTFGGLYSCVLYVRIPHAQS